MPFGRAPSVGERKERNTGKKGREDDGRMRAADRRGRQRSEREKGGACGCADERDPRVGRENIRVRAVWHRPSGVGQRGMAEWSGSPRNG